MLVVGAGVIGLTCAVRLAETGHDVHVLARDLPAETTSAVAAAWWYPYRAAPQVAVGRWARRSYAAFEELADVPRAGVVMRDSVELHRTSMPDPWWTDTVPELRRPPDLPAGFVDGWQFTAPVIEMPVYLGYLTARLRAAGGTLTRLALSSLPEGGDVVVNASGLAARSLADDAGMYPVRGQVVRVAQVGVERVWLDETLGGMTYVVPRSHDVVLGGSDDEWAWDRTPDPVLSQRILDRARALVPELAAARVLGVRVGLRPCRAAVRLEVQDRLGAAPVVHCYGHGGAGVTLSWGCADDVAAAVAGLDRDGAGAGGLLAQNSRSAGSSMPRSAS